LPGSGGAKEKKMLENKWTLKIKQLQERIDYLESCLRAAGDNVQINQQLLKLAWEQLYRAEEASAGEEEK
jgi:hypothetical protein